MDDLSQIYTEVWHGVRLIVHEDEAAGKAFVNSDQDAFGGNFGINVEANNTGLGIYSAMQEARGWVDLYLTEFDLSGNLLPALQAREEG